MINIMILISIDRDQESWEAGYFRDCNGESNGQVSPNHHHHCHLHCHLHCHIHPLPHQHQNVDPRQALEGGVIREEALEAASNQGQSLVSAQYLGISQVQ